MKKRKLSNIIFWSYLALVYLSFVIALVVVAFKLKKAQPKYKLDLSKYHYFQKIQPFDTLVIKHNINLKLQYAPDTNVLAYNVLLGYEQHGKTLIINLCSENIAAVTSSSKNIVLIVDSSEANVVYSYLDNLQLAADNATVNLVGDWLDKLNIKANHSTINLALTGINDLELDLQHTNLQLATVKVKNIYGYADSSSAIETAQFFNMNLDIHGGAKIKTN